MRVCAGQGFCTGLGFTFHVCDIYIYIHIIGSSVLCVTIASTAFRYMSLTGWN